MVNYTHVHVNIYDLKYVMLVHRLSINQTDTVLRV